MIEQKIDLWDAIKDAPICITTNGTIKKNGAAVMGAGCALELAKLSPNFPWRLGTWLGKNGNIVMGWNVKEFDNPIITFPVKHNWWEKADIDLIVQSCMQLNKCINENGFEKVYLPRPGCGNGQLDWATEVKPVISEVLLKKVIVVWK